ncbi:MAG: hypothetical protein KVP17_004943 [Porospora cf. gigantea B]|uniref:uncharacterized protein n=1 Tax=Porospora cf. gigantea B TaxID=2853592 RepID=UPI003571E711|nr:MAG: hypothetical protein KVP17_004943 [Porospora cf. gigantea B]
MRTLPLMATGFALVEQLFREDNDANVHKHPQYPHSALQLIPAMGGQPAQHADVRGTIGNVLTAALPATGVTRCWGHILMTAYSHHQEDDYPFQSSCDITSENEVLCFSDAAQVDTPQGPMGMSSLSVGDLVGTEIGFEPVLFFLHQEPDATSEFVRIYHADKDAYLHGDDLPEYREIVMSKDHVAFAAKAGGGQHGMMRARDVRFGDYLVARDGLRVVLSSEPVDAKGIFAPVTASGTLEVDGILVSAFADPEHLRQRHSWWLKLFSHRLLSDEELALDPKLVLGMMVHRLSMRLMSPIMWVYSNISEPESMLRAPIRLLEALPSAVTLKYAKPMEPFLRLMAQVEALIFW